MSKWYEDVERQQDVYVYSRIRLARNIKGRVFPNKMNDQEARQTIGMLAAGFAELGLPYGDLSHCPEEYTTKEDLGDSADVLLGTLKTLGETEKL